MTQSAPPKVFVANVNPGQVGLWFTKCMVDLVKADLLNDWGVWAGNLWAESGANVSKQRNELVKMFLATDGDWLLFVDSDMVFPPDTIVRLLGAAAKADCKVIGGLCVMVGELGPIPTLYQHDDVPGSAGVTRVQFDYPDNALLQVAATGGACLMVHRQVLDAHRRAQAGNKAWLLGQRDNPVVAEMVARDLIADPSEEFGWFGERVRVRRVLGPGGQPLSREHWVSEDIELCLRLGSLGFPVFVDCTLEIGHRKHGRTWHASDIRDGTGMPKPPVVAVIPVKDQLHLTSDLVAQIREQGGCDEIVVCDNGSGKATKDWLSTQDDVTVIDSPGVGIHTMWNRAIDHTLDKHGARARIAFLNNDLRLGPAFLRTLSQALTDHRELTAVCGNYDGRSADTPMVETTEICANRYDGSGGFAGFAFMAKGEWFSSGYRFPDQCMWWYGDNDLLRSLAISDTDDSPKKAGIVVAATVEHLGGGGQTAGDPSWSKHREQTEADREAFEERWRTFLDIEDQRRRMQSGDLGPLYEHLCGQDTDVKAHLPRFHQLVLDMKAQHVIELGVRQGVSSVAWLAALHQTGGHLWAVDLEAGPGHVANHPRCTFTQGDDLDPFVLAQLPDRADIVFIDSSHTYDHTVKELATYADRVRPGGCLVLHDVAVEAFEEHTTSQPPFPVRKAVEELTADRGLNVDWYDDSFGLAVVWMPEAAA